MNEDRITLSEEVIVMASDPLPEWTPHQVESWYGQNPGEQSLATAFAVASNKFWWVEDNVYDCIEGTSKYEEACKIVDSWKMIMNKLEDEIFAILIREGITIPKTGQITVLIPFMERNGYYDGNGWWVHK